MRRKNKGGRDRGESSAVGGNEEEDFEVRVQRRMRHPSSDVARQILGLDNIDTSAACQSQGFLFGTLFLFIPFNLFTNNHQGFTLLISESYPL